jgi:hypothetical protein
MSEPLKVTILITNLTTNDDGFGVRPDTNEGVYMFTSRRVLREPRALSRASFAPRRSSRTTLTGS